MKKLLTASWALMIALSACTHHTYTVSNKDSGESGRYITKGYSESRNPSGTPKIRAKLPMAIGGVADAFPNATAFRMSGDYSQNVAVTLSPEGELLYFPAPSDITADSEPTELKDGWWLNNQGLGPNSVFTKYTFAEYASLPEAPSPQQIKLSILPAARVTDFIELPMKISDARDNIKEVNDYLKGK